MGGVSRGPTEREHPAQAAPSPALDLRGFPARAMPAGTAVFRAHRTDRGPWWFGSDGGGRFDLGPPRGTCYLADTPLVAVRERLGIVLGPQRRVAAAVLDGVVVSRLGLVAAISVANLRSTRAGGFGVLNELSTMVPYDVPQAWARALGAAGFDGVRYPARFSTGRAGSIALFGLGGDRSSWPRDPGSVPAADVQGAPVRRPSPRLRELTVVRTPRRRAGRPGRPR